MTLDQFYAKYNNQPVDVDMHYGNQCWDLAALYNELVIGIPASQDYGLPTGPIGGAKEVYTYFKDPLPNYFVRLSTSTVPQKGDLVVWDVGQFGHIAIFLKGTLQNFQSFDQNWPVGSYAHLQQHDSQGVIGFLRPKANLTTGEDGEMVTREIMDKVWPLITYDSKGPTQADYDAWEGKKDLHTLIVYKIIPELTANNIVNWGDLVNAFAALKMNPPTDADNQTWNKSLWKKFAEKKLEPEAKQRIK